MIFGTLLTIALIPTGSFAQEPVSVFGPVEIKKEKPSASEYEKLLRTHGRVVISKKIPVGDPSLRIFVRSSYRENASSLRVYTLHRDSFSIDLEKIPRLVSDLESFVKRMKESEGKEDQEVWFRYSDDYYASFTSYRDSKGIFKQNLYLYLGGYDGQSPESSKKLPIYIEGLKQGYSKLRELKRAR